jgi:hypothetical protein
MRILSPEAEKLIEGAASAKYDGDGGEVMAGRRDAMAFLIVRFGRSGASPNH